ncbi:MAG: beta-lactamase family protein [Acidobacteria bacterium]|nr:beta-lactamase family protein [Acidobacteriota bacterium]
MRPAVRVAVALCCLSLAVPAAAQSLPKAASPEAVGLSAERLARITTVMRDAVRDKQAAGTVTVVLRDGQVAYFEAEGAQDAERGTAMKTDSIFRIASMTKAVVSVGVMMLVEEGRLSLTDPVAKFIPAFAKTTVLAEQNGRVAVVPATRPITIRDLLTHTAGISYGAGALEPYYSAAGFTAWYFADRAQPMTAWIDKLATLPFESQPGERWVYGYNTDVLGNVIERLTGQTLAAFVAARITTPLKMVDTSFFLPADKAGRLAAVYAVGDTGAITRAPEGTFGQGMYTSGPRVAFSGGAGLLSTAQDYARFMQMLLNGGELEGTRLLSPTTVALMTSNHVGALYLNGTLGWGLGFEVVEQPGRAPRYGAAGEFSWSGAYHTTYWADPAEKLVVVFMTQLLPAGAVDLRYRIRTLVNQAIVGPVPGRAAGQ